MSFKSWLVTHFYHRKSFFDPTLNHSRLPQHLTQQFHQGIMLDIGAGDQKLHPNLITLDLYSRTDIRADAQHLPVKSNSVDLALSIAVLEHVPEPFQVVQEIFRTLKPGGQVYLEIPFLQPLHASPNDYYRATLPGLLHWCRQFDEISSGVCVGPGSTLNWIMIEYAKIWFSHLSFIALPLEILTRLTLLPLKWLDRLIINHPHSATTASAVYFHGRKPLVRNQSHSTKA